MNLKTLFLLYLLAIIKSSVAQKSVLFEAGATYFTNNIDVPSTRLYDFAATTLSTRVMLLQKGNSSVSVEVPISLRTRNKQDVTTRFGLHLPLWVVYNYGAGSSGLSSDKKIGLLAGVGYGYFQQKTRSRNGEPEQYNESLSTHGPEAIAGIRFPVKNIVLFKMKEQEVHPSINIRFINLINLENSSKNIGAVSLTAGFSF